MLLGALGRSDYDQPAKIVTPYFGSSGTGQLNAAFPVTAQSGDAAPGPQASLTKSMTYGESRLQNKIIA